MPLLDHAAAREGGAGGTLGDWMLCGQVVLLLRRGLPPGALVCGGTAHFMTAGGVNRRHLVHPLLLAVLAHAVPPGPT
jgi:hypothetical protein